MSKPKKRTRQVHVRLSDEELAMLDAERETMAKAYPFRVRVTYGDIVRELIARAHSKILRKSA